MSLTRGNNPRSILQREPDEPFAAVCDKFMGRERLEDVGGKDWIVFDVSATGERLDHPSSVDIGPEGAICVADFGNNRIVRMSDMTGADWQSIDNLDHPISVRVADHGRLYVGLAYRPGVHIYQSIKGDGHRVLKTGAAPRGILVP